MKNKKLKTALMENRGSAKYMEKIFGALITEIDEVIEDVGISINKLDPTDKNIIADLLDDLRTKRKEIEKIADKIVVHCLK